MKVVVSNPSVAPHVKQTVTAFYEAGYLDKFFTTFFEHPDNRLSALLKKIEFIKPEINRRSFHDIPIEKIGSRQLPELLRSIAARKLHPVTADAIWEWAELGFDRWVASKINDEMDAVYTYEHAALATLQKAKSLKKFCIYEQSSVHHTFFTAMAKQQLSLYPELMNPELNLKTNALSAKRNSRRDKELEVADLVICNSTFTKKTLIAAGFNPEKIVANSLAFPCISSKHVTKEDLNKPIVFLHAGNQSLTKASHILYQAWRNCQFDERDAELWLVGKMALPPSFSNNLPGKVIVKTNIPHVELMKLYEKADVLIMPTLADGFGMVITEAMSQGLPVISSTNCCGPDIIEHMKDGWVIPAGDIIALEEQIKWCVNNKQALPPMGIAARDKAAGWQWPQYRRSLSEIIFTEWEKFQK